MNTATCPHCENECDMNDFENDCTEMDWECEHCLKEFHIKVEYDPIFNSSKIKIKTCGACHKDTREYAEKGRRFPYPKTQHQILCNECYYKMIFAEMDADKEK